jgi:hypothetical protein
MTEHFTCRNGHRWDLSVEGAIINERWVYCPACGAPPRPAAVLTGWQRLQRWARRNPAVIGLLACILISVATVASLVVMQWREAERARQEAERALQEAEGALESQPWNAARDAAYKAARAINE